MTVVTLQTLRYRRYSHDVTDVNAGGASLCNAQRGAAVPCEKHEGGSCRATLKICIATLRIRIAALTISIATLRMVIAKATIIHFSLAMLHLRSMH